MKNNGQIIRSSKNGKSNFTPISNEILQSEVLTCEQKSILVHLLSLPSDWVIYKTTFWKKMNIGRDRFFKAWKGLVELGYIKENVITGKNNLIEGYSYIVYELPVSVNPISSKPEIDTIQELISDIPNIGNTEIQSTQEPVDIQSNNIQSNNIQSNNIQSNNIQSNNIQSNNIEKKDIIKTSINTGANFQSDFESYKNHYNQHEEMQFEIEESIASSCKEGKYILDQVKADNYENIKNELDIEIQNKIEQRVNRFYLNRNVLLMIKKRLEPFYSAVDSSPTSDHIK